MSTDTLKIISDNMSALADQVKAMNVRYLRIEEEISVLRKIAASATISDKIADEHINYMLDRILDTLRSNAYATKIPNSETRAAMEEIEKMCREKDET